MTLEESIFFYTRNDYLLINNLLCNNISELRRFADIVNTDSKGMLKEHSDGINVLSDQMIRYYQSRIYEEWNEATESEIIERAKNDVSNILGAMGPTEKDTLLYRTVWHRRFGDILNYYKDNEFIEFQNISSTSVTPYEEDTSDSFYRFEIVVPKGSPVLELDQFAPWIRNEDGEVLLPPMKCKVKSIRESDIFNCKGIIQLKYIDQLEVRI